MLRLEPGQQDPVTDCMIQNVWNDQVFKLFIDAYKKSYSYESLWGISRDHVEFGRIWIRFFKNVSDDEIGRGS